MVHARLWGQADSRKRQWLTQGMTRDHYRWLISSLGACTVQSCPGRSCRSTAAARRPGCTPRWTLRTRSRSPSSSASASPALRVSTACMPSKARVIVHLHMHRGLCTSALCCPLAQVSSFISCFEKGDVLGWVAQTAHSLYGKPKYVFCQKNYCWAVKAVSWQLTHAVCCDRGSGVQAGVWEGDGPQRAAAGG